MKRYSFDGDRPFIDESYGNWVTFEDAKAELDMKLDPGIKTALCGEIRNLRNDLTARTLERDELQRRIDAFMKAFRP